MSTRAIVALTEHDGRYPLLFHREFNGERKSVAPHLDLFCTWLREQAIRNDASRAGGWFMIQGYRSLYGSGVVLPRKPVVARQHARGSVGCRPGVYEPCTVAALNSGVDWVHVVNTGSGYWGSLMLRGERSLALPFRRMRAAERDYYAARGGGQGAAAMRSEETSADLCWQEYVTAVFKCIQETHFDLSVVSQMEAGADASVVALHRLQAS